MRQKEVNDEEVKLRLLNGYPVKQIARDLHCSQSTIWRVRSTLKDEHGEVPRVATMDEGKIWALAYGRWSMEAITHECRCTPEDVHRVVRDRMRRIYGQA